MCANQPSKLISLTDKFVNREEYDRGIFPDKARIRDVKTARREMSRRPNGQITKQFNAIRLSGGHWGTALSVRCQISRPVNSALQEQGEAKRQGPLYVRFPAA